MVPPGPLAKLQAIPIWVELFHPRHPCMCYHASPEWLRQLSPFYYYGQPVVGQTHWPPLAVLAALAALLLLASAISFQRRDLGR